MVGEVAHEQASDLPDDSMRQGLRSPRRGSIRDPLMPGIAGGFSFYRPGGLMGTRGREEDLQSLEEDLKLMLRPAAR